MLFYSHTFLLFFFVFLPGFVLSRGDARLIYVCIASYVFYAWWYPPYLAVLVGLTIYAHVFARVRGLSRTQFGAVLGLGLLPLVVFKYAGFVMDNFAVLSGYDVGIRPDWKLPLGVSFVTFTALAYVIDGRMGRLPPELRFWHSALFISYFPHLIAGPILRGREVLPQLSRLQFQPSMVKTSVLLFAIGAVKKVAVADQIAPAVTEVYNSEAPINLLESAFAFYGFAVQIYCDFSGYTDMALALAFFMGIRLPLNFDRPYLSASLRDFWRRWHRTLSRWLRDYLYIPLGGSRAGLPRTMLAILVTMLLGGLWHGAAWTFVLWGAVHGVLVAGEHFRGRRIPERGRIPRWLRIVVVAHVVFALWVLFRAPNLDRVFDLFGGFFVPGGMDLLARFPLVPFLIVATLALHPLDSVARVRYAARRLPSTIVFPLSAMLIAICSALSVQNPSTFIYFDF